MSDGVSSSQPPWNQFLLPSSTQSGNGGSATQPLWMSLVSSTTEGTTTTTSGPGVDSLPAAITVPVLCVFAFIVIFGFVMACLRLKRRSRPPNKHPEQQGETVVVATHLPSERLASSHVGHSVNSCHTTPPIYPWLVDSYPADRHRPVTDSKSNGYYEPTISPLAYDYVVPNRRDNPDEGQFVSRIEFDSGKSLRPPAARFSRTTLKEEIPSLPARRPATSGKDLVNSNIPIITIIDSAGKPTKSSVHIVKEWDSAEKARKDHTHTTRITESNSAGKQAKADIPTVTEYDSGGKPIKPQKPLATEQKSGRSPQKQNQHTQKHDSSNNPKNFLTVNGGSCDFITPKAFTPSQQQYRKITPARLRLGGSIERLQKASFAVSDTINVINALILSPLNGVTTRPSPRDSGSDSAHTNKTSNNSHSTITNCYKPKTSPTSDQKRFLWSPDVIMTSSMSLPVLPTMSSIEEDVALTTKYVAMYAYAADREGLIDLSPNDIIVTEQGAGEAAEVVNGWILGENRTTGKKGWFPVTHVRQAMSPKVQKKMPLSAQLQQQLQLLQLSKEEQIQQILLQSQQQLARSSQLPNTDEDTAVFDLEDSDGEFDDISAPNEVYRAMYDYAGQQEGDLTFKFGEVIHLYEKQESGWWKGTCDEREGWFPGNYVEKIGEGGISAIIETGDNQTPKIVESTSVKATSSGEILRRTKKTHSKDDAAFEMANFDVKKSTPSNLRGATLPRKLPSNMITSSSASELNENGNAGADTPKRRWPKLPKLPKSRVPNFLKKKTRLGSLGSLEPGEVAERPENYSRKSFDLSSIPSSHSLSPNTKTSRSMSIPLSDRATLGLRGPSQSSGVVLIKSTPITDSVSQSVSWNGETNPSTKIADAGSSSMSPIPTEAVYLNSVAQVTVNNETFRKENSPDSLILSGSKLANRPYATVHGTEPTNSNVTISSLATKSTSFIVTTEPSATGVQTSSETISRIATSGIPTSCRDSKSPIAANSTTSVSDNSSANIPFKSVVYVENTGSIRDVIATPAAIQIVSTSAAPISHNVFFSSRQQTTSEQPGAVVSTPERVDKPLMRRYTTTTDSDIPRRDDEVDVNDQGNKTIERTSRVANVRLSSIPEFLSPGARFSVDLNGLLISAPEGFEDSFTIDTDAVTEDPPHLYSNVDDLSTNAGTLSSLTVDECDSRSDVGTQYRHNSTDSTVESLPSHQTIRQTIGNFAAESSTSPWSLNRQVIFPETSSLNKQLENVATSNAAKPQINLPKPNTTLFPLQSSSSQLPVADFMMPKDVVSPQLTSVDHLYHCSDAKIHANANNFNKQQPYLPIHNNTGKSERIYANAINRLNNQESIVTSDVGIFTIQEESQDSLASEVESNLQDKNSGSEALLMSMTDSQPMNDPTVVIQTLSGTVEEGTKDCPSVINVTRQHSSGLINRYKKLFDPQCQVHIDYAKTNTNNSENVSDIDMQAATSGMSSDANPSKTNEFSEDVNPAKPDENQRVSGSRSSVEGPVPKLYSSYQTRISRSTSSPTGIMPTTQSSSVFAAGSSVYNRFRSIPASASASPVFVSTSVKTAMPKPKASNGAASNHSKTDKRKQVLANGYDSQLVPTRNNAGKDAIESVAVSDVNEKSEMAVLKPSAPCQEASISEQNVRKLSNVQFKDQEVTRNDKLVEKAAAVNVNCAKRTQSTPLPVMKILDIDFENQTTNSKANTDKHHNVAGNTSVQKSSHSTDSLDVNSSMKGEYKAEKATNDKELRGNYDVMTNDRKDSSSFLSEPVSVEKTFPSSTVSVVTQNIGKPNVEEIASKSSLQSAPSGSLHSAPNGSLHSAPNGSLHSAPNGSLHSALNGASRQQKIERPLRNDPNDTISSSLKFFTPASFQSSSRSSGPVTLQASPTNGNGESLAPSNDNVDVLLTSLVTEKSTTTGRKDEKGFEIEGHPLVDSRTTLSLKSLNVLCPAPYKAASKDLILLTASSTNELSPELVLPSSQVANAIFDEEEVGEESII